MYGRQASVTREPSKILSREGWRFSGPRKLENETEGGRKIRPDLDREVKSIMGNGSMNSSVHRALIRKGPDIKPGFDWESASPGRS